MKDNCYSGHHHHEEIDGSCGCGIKSYFKHHEHEHGCGCFDKFFAIADEAWKEVLKDKIKSKILEHKEKHMDELASLIAKANAAKWKNKISAKVKQNEFKDELKQFFSSCE